MEMFVSLLFEFHTGDGEGEFYSFAVETGTSSISLKLAPVPTSPNWESSVVAEFEHLVALFHFHGDDGRRATESDLGAFHFNLVFGLDLHVLVLQIPAGTEVDRDGFFAGGQSHMNPSTHSLVRGDLGNTNNLPGHSFDGFGIIHSVIGRSRSPTAAAPPHHSRSHLRKGISR